MTGNAPPPPDKQLRAVLQAIAEPERTTHELRAVTLKAAAIIADEIAKVEHKYTAVAGLARLTDHGGSLSHYDTMGGLVLDLTRWTPSPIDRAAVALVRSYQPACDDQGPDLLPWSAVAGARLHLAATLRVLRTVAQSFEVEALFPGALTPFKNQTVPPRP